MLPVPPAVLFRAYDVRGRIDAGLSPENIHAVGRALGSEARARGFSRIASGRDGRLSSPALQQALNDGLAASGLTVLDIGPAATPQLYFAALEHADGCGAMITGSHNPPEYNGVKMMLGGHALAEGAIADLRRRLLDNDLIEAPGRCETLVIDSEYRQRMLATSQLARPLKVVLDCGHGTAALAAPAMLEGLGCEVHPLYCTVDGRFPHHHPDPSRPENLADLQRAVLEQNADIGLAFDGDGDRLGVVGPDGAILWPDRLLMLFAGELLSRHPGATVLYDVKCSGQLEQLIREAGGEPVMCRTGHSLLKAELERRGALLGGEMSGHLIVREGWYPVDDALYAAVRLLALLAADERPVAEQLAALPDSPATPELQIPMQEGENFAFMQRLAALGDDDWDGRVNHLDGIRVDYADGWGLVRASNTTPSLTLRFQGDDAAALARVEERFRQRLLAVEPSLELPF